MKKEQDIFFMEKALLQAKCALKKNEVPIGAVVVDKQGVILGRGYNKIESNGCQLAHAEIEAIKKACKKKGDWRLDGCWIYVTLEPCLMCLGLILLSRMNGVVFGAKSKFLLPMIGKVDNWKLFKNNLIVKCGLKEKESTDILKRFFADIRKKKRKVKSETKSTITRKS